MVKSALKDYAEKMQGPSLRIELSAKDRVGEIDIYGTIGQDWFGEGVEPKTFKQDVAALGELDRLNVHVHSYGGSVYEGWAIFNTLDTHSADVHVYVDGSAMSMASVILQAADTRHIAKNGTVMIHNPWSIAMGEAKDFEKAAANLKQIRTQIIDAYIDGGVTASREEVERMMDEETYMTAEQALEHGFVDVIGEEVEEDPDATNMVAMAQLFAMSGNPEKLKEVLNMPTGKQPAEPENSLTPEAAQAQADQARADERKRVSDILALSRPGIEAFVQDLAKSDIDVADAKMQVADKLTEQANDKLQTRRKDSNSVVTEEEEELDTAAVTLKDQWEKNVNGVQEHFLDFEGFEAFAKADEKGLIKMLGGKK